MGLFDGLNAVRRTSGVPPTSTPGPTNYFRGTSPFGGGGGGFASGPSGSDTSKTRGVPERFDVNTIYNQLSGQTPSDPSMAVQVVQHAARAAPAALGAPLALFNQGMSAITGGQSNPILDFIGSIPTFLPNGQAYSGLGDSNEGFSINLLGMDMHFANVRGVVNTVGRGMNVPATAVRALINGTQAQTIRDAYHADPNAPVKYAGIPTLSGALAGHAETNAEYLARMTRLGFTPDEQQQIANGRSLLTFGDPQHRFSEDGLTEFGMTMATDPLMYIPVLGESAWAQRGAKAFMGTPGMTVARQAAGGAMDVLRGSRVALGTRAGVGLLRDAVSGGWRSAAIAPAHIGARMLAQGAEGAVANATRFSLGQYLVEASRTVTPFARGFGMGFGMVAKPVVSMFRTALDVPGYFSGGWKGYASHAAALRGSEAAIAGFGNAADWANTTFGDGHQVGGWTETLRDIGQALINETPLADNQVSMLVAGYMFPFKEIASEAGGAIRAPYEDVVYRNMQPGEYLGRFNGAMKQMFLPDMEPGAARDAEFVRMFGGEQNAQAMLNDALVNIARRRLIKDTVLEWKIRNTPAMAGRVAESARTTAAAVDYMLEHNMIHDRDIQNAIREMDAGTGGFDTLKENRPKGASVLGGGQMNFDPRNAVVNYIRFRAAGHPIMEVNRELGLQIAPAVREVLHSETIAEARSFLSKVASGKGNARTVDVVHVQRMLRDHPQILLNDATGYFKDLSNMGAGYQVKWRSLKGKLDRMHDAAPSWDQTTAEFTAQENAATTGLGPTERSSGSLALQDGKTRLARAIPGEARVAVSRMRPELGAAPNTLGETRALRTNDSVQRFERNVGMALHDAGLPVQQVHQTIGSWETDGKVAREPSVAITLTEDATLADARSVAALTGQVASQDASLLYVTGSAMERLGVQPTGSLIHFRGISDRSLNRVDQVLYRRYGQDGYTLDDTAGEAVVYAHGATPAQIADDAAAVAAEARLKQHYVEPAYGEYIARGDTLDQYYQEALSNDPVRSQKFNAVMDDALNNPDFNESSLAQHVAGSEFRTFLTPAERRGGGASTIRHGTATYEGVLRDTLIRLEGPDGKPVPGLEADHAHVADTLEALMKTRRDFLTTVSHVDQYDRTPPDPFTPLAKDQAVGEVVPFKDTIPKRIFGDGQVTGVEGEPPAFPVGTVREAPNGGHMILREVPADSITWGQDTADPTRVAEIARGEKVVSTEYPSVGLFRGHLLGIDGHHRIAAAIKRGEATVKVWVGEFKDDGSIRPPPVNIKEAAVLDPTTGKWTTGFTDNPDYIFAGSMAPLYEVAENLPWKTMDEWNGGQRLTVRPNAYTGAVEPVPGGPPIPPGAWQDTSLARTGKVDVVPVDVVRRFVEFDRRGAQAQGDSAQRITDLTQSIRDRGLDEPLVFEYSAKDGTMRLSEGHHRLEAAIDAGLDAVPVHVVRREGSLPAGHGAAVDRPLVPDEFGYTPGNFRPSEVLNFERNAAVPKRVDIQTRYDLAEEQVVFNRQRDAEMAKLFPEINWDRKAGILTPEEKASLGVFNQFMASQFGGAYDIVAAPELAFPTDSVVPAMLKARTEIGEWLYQYGPMSKVAATLDTAFHPVRSVPQAALARQALYRMLVPAGATVEQVDKWLGRMHDFTGTLKFPGKHEVRVFRDATSLFPHQINQAAVEAFPQKVIDAIGQDNFHLVLDRGANRFVRDTLFPGLTGGGKRGRLQRTLAAGYQIFQTGSLEGNLGDLPKPKMGKRVPGLRSVAESKRLMAKTAYPIIRFIADPRWWLQNWWEYNILSTVRDGIWGGKEIRGHSGRAATGGDAPTQAGFTAQLDTSNLEPGAVRAAGASIDDSLVDIESVGGGMMHNRAVAGFVTRIWKKRTLDNTEEIINRWHEADGWLRDVERLFPENDVRTRYEKLNDMLYNFDEKGVAKTVMDDARQAFGAKLTKDMEPMLFQLIDRHERSFEDVINMLQGNANRSNVERVLNSWWLFWPLSYQLKATRWLYQSMFESYGGKKTNMGGASYWNYVVDQHHKRLLDDPTYRQFFADHQGMWAFAAMFMPLTPGDVGVSLNRGIRGIGGALGWWGEYKRAQDPVTFALWMAEMGPFFTMSLVQQLAAETWKKRTGPHEVATGIGGDTRTIDSSGASPGTITSGPSGPAQAPIFPPPSPQ